MVILVIREDSIVIPPIIKMLVGFKVISIEKVLFLAEAEEEERVTLIGLNVNFVADSTILYSSVIIALIKTFSLKLVK